MFNKFTVMVAGAMLSLVGFASESDAQINVGVGRFRASVGGGYGVQAGFVPRGFVPVNQFNRNFFVPARNFGYGFNQARFFVPTFAPSYSVGFNAGCYHQPPAQLFFVPQQAPTQYFYTLPPAQGFVAPQPQLQPAPAPAPAAAPIPQQGTFFTPAAPAYTATFLATTTGSCGLVGYGCSAPVASFVPFYGTRFFGRY